MEASVCRQRSAEGHQDGKMSIDRSNGEEEEVTAETGVGGQRMFWSLVEGKSTPAPLH